MWDEAGRGIMIMRVGREGALAGPTTVGGWPSINPPPRRPSNVETPAGKGVSQAGQSGEGVRWGRVGGKGDKGRRTPRTLGQTARHARTGKGARREQWMIPRGGGGRHHGGREGGRGAAGVTHKRAPAGGGADWPHRRPAGRTIRCGLATTRHCGWARGPRAVSVLLATHLGAVAPAATAATATAAATTFVFRQEGFSPRAATRWTSRRPCASAL